MLTSMTGYGSGTAEGPELKLSVEIRTLNNKGLDLHVRVPRGYLALEDGIRRRVRDRIRRGRVDVFLTVIEAPMPAGKVRINQGLAEQYQAALGDLARQLGLEQDIRLGELLRLPDLLEVIEPPLDADALMPAVQEALEGALDGVLSSRQAEGDRLQADLLERLSALEQLVEELAGMAPELAERIRERIRAGVRRLLPEIEPDAGRLEQEAALLADKADVNEELVRLRSHILRFRELMERGRPVGKELEFLTQELLREVNTTGSKLGEQAAMRRVLDMKGEVNRIREQVGNVE